MGGHHHEEHFGIFSLLDDRRPGVGRVAMPSLGLGALCGRPSRELSEVPLDDGVRVYPQLPALRVDVMAHRSVEDQQDAKLLVKTCHRRGAFAMGGMAAQIPVRGDQAANEAAFAKVRADKEREARQGHDGTWVAHPDLVPVAKDVFDELMPEPNQLDKLAEDVSVTRDDLLQVHEGERTEAGLRENIRVGIQYIEAWLEGRGAVPLYNLMEDAATAEISRAQIWQWLYHRARLDDGREVTPDLFRDIRDDEMAKVRQAIGPTTFDAGQFDDATELFTDMSLALEFEEFLTLPAYERL